MWLSIIVQALQEVGGHWPVLDRQDQIQSRVISSMDNWAHLSGNWCVLGMPTENEKYCIQRISMGRIWFSEFMVAGAGLR